MALIQKAFSDIITFSRSSNATRVGPNGLVQYAPHNLLTYSEQFDNAAWTKTGASVTANTVASPDGTVTADSLIEDATLNAHRVSQTISVTSGVTYTISVFAKARTRTFVQLLFPSGEFGVNAFANFNLSTGALGTVGSASTAVITSVGNGWYRCSVSAVATATGASGSVLIQIVTSGTAARNENYTGDGVSGLYIWGAQLSVGPLPLDYTPTTTAAVYGPRFDYDGSGVTAVQPIARNLLTYSEQFDNAAWIKTRSSITANTIVAPDGTITGDKLVEDTTASNSHIMQADTSLGGSVDSSAYTISIYAKAGERLRFRLRDVFQTTSGLTVFDLTNGTVVTGTGAISSVGNGWYRCSIFPLKNLSTTSRLEVALVDSGTNATYTGDGTSGLYIWGAQLEIGSTATDYMVSGATNGFRAAPIVTGSATARGLLVEEQRTNLLLQSEDFNTTWALTRANVTTNVIASPDGTVTADKLYENTTASNTHYVAQTLSLTSGTTYTSSVYAKAGERTIMRFRVTGTGTWADAYFNLATGTVVSGTGTITSVGNGWYRCSISGASDLTGTNNCLVQLTDASGNATYTGDGTSGLYLWGAQMEAGSFATSYIPTIASTVTRSADVASVNTLSPWFNATEGTLFTEFDFPYPAVTVSGYPSIVSINDGTTSNEITSYIQPTSSHSGRFYIASGGVSQADLDTTTSLVSNTPYKLAATYKVNDIAASILGQTPVTDSSASIPTVSAMQIGLGRTTSQYSGHIRRLAYYPRRLTNAELQALTA